jgi:hypothetical protein
VIDTTTQALLQEIVRRESRSVLIYVGAAFPWTTSRGEETLVRLRRLIADEGRAIAALGQYLVRRHLPPPYTASYPSSFTTINFLALDYVLPRLVEDERRSLTDLERDLPRITDAEARAEVDKLAAVKRRHLAELQALAAAQQPQPAGA